MQPEVKEWECLEQRESPKLNKTQENIEELCKIEQQEPSEETTDKSGIAGCCDPNTNYQKEILTTSDNDNQQHKDEPGNASEFTEIKQEEESGQSDNTKEDNQEVDEEEEVEEKDDEADKMNEEKSSQDPENQDNAYEQDRLSFLGRNRRVRQKNRYFLDFHCVDLTKGARSNRDDYDAFTTAASTRSSNRRSTTDSTRAQDEADVFESRYCRKCLNKTAHDIDGGCQACLYKKIVESSKRQRPASQRNRNASSRQQHDNETDSSTTNTTTTTATPSSSSHNNGNKRKSTKQGGSKCSNNTTATINTTVTNNNNSNNNNNNNNDIVNNKNVNGNSINNYSTKLPKLDSWTPDEVAEFIGSRGFNDEANLFKLQSVDGISLLLMQRTDFTYGLKIKLGPALKIYDQVCKLKKDYFRTLTTST